MTLQRDDSWRPLAFVPNGLSMYVAYPKARATDPQVVAFRDWLLRRGESAGCRRPGMKAGLQRSVWRRTVFWDGVRGSPWSFA